MTRLISMIAVSGLVLSAAAPGLWAADAPSTATPPSVAAAPSTATSPSVAAAPSTATPPSVAAAPATAAPATVVSAPTIAAPTRVAAVKPRQTVHRKWRPQDHMANELNRQVLSQLNTTGSTASYGSSR